MNASQLLPRFEDLHLGASHPVARLAFANKYFAKVQEEQERPGSYEVEMLNEFGTTLRTRRELPPEEVTAELERIAATMSADD